MAIWAARPVVDVPLVTLQDWRILETSTGERHFVGFRPERGTRRVSSVIINLNVRSRLGMTRSGRQYFLEGPPGAPVGQDDDVWSAWCRVNRVTGYRDVTIEALADAL